MQVSICISSGGDLLKEPVQLFSWSSWDFMFALWNFLLFPFLVLNKDVEDLKPQSGSCEINTRLTELLKIRTSFSNCSVGSVFYKVQKIKEIHSSSDDVLIFLVISHLGEIVVGQLRDRQMLAQKLTYKV